VLRIYLRQCIQAAHSPASCTPHLFVLCSLELQGRGLLVAIGSLASGAFSGPSSQANTGSHCSDSGNPLVELGTGWFRSASLRCATVSLWAAAICLYVLPRSSSHRRRHSSVAPRHGSKGFPVRSTAYLGGYCRLNSVQPC
jgi:hypothetical protein